jgi:hypothetical protein
VPDAAGDGGQHGGELGGDDHHAFLVELGRVDVQEQDLADGRVAVLVFVDVELGQLEHFLDADAFSRGPQPVV